MIEEHLDDCEAEDKLRRVFFACFALQQIRQSGLKEKEPQPKKSPQKSLIETQKKEQEKAKADLLMIQEIQKMVHQKELEEKEKREKEEQERQRILEEQREMLEQEQRRLEQEQAGNKEDSQLKSNEDCDATDVDVTGFLDNLSNDSSPQSDRNRPGS